MPIYEFACPACRTIYSFLSKRLNPARKPVCPRCGARNLEKQVSGFALIRGASEAEAAADDGAPMPDLDNPKVMRAMEQLEKSLGDTQEENPRDVARMLRQVQEVLPPGSMPRDFEHAIRRLESGEDPESVEADMGDALDAWKKTSRARERDRKKQAPFRRDPGLYEL